MCDCMARIQREFKNQHDIDGTIEIELTTGKTYSNLNYTEINKNGTGIRKNMPILHSHCPWCGEKYGSGEVEK